MKIQLLVSTGILLVALLPRCHECRALLSQSVPAAPAPDSSASRPPDAQQQPPPSWPDVLRRGEEYFLRLGHLRKAPSAAAAAASFSSTSSHLAASGSAGDFFRAAVRQLHQSRHIQERSLEGAAAAAAGRWEGEGEDSAPPPETAAAAASKEKRSEEPPISLDLTFHLLREVLEMARAEQLAQQAHSNRKLMEIIGK